MTKSSRRSKRFVALVARSRGRKTLLDLAHGLAGLGYTPTVETSLARKIGAAACRKAGIVVRADGARPAPELAVALGGDGSFLQMAVRFGPLGVPVIGVNLGRVGFLADINSSAMVEEVGKVLAGKYRDEKRIMLVVEHRRGKRVLATQTVVNDAVIDRGEAGKLISMDVVIDSKTAFQMRGDGLILSTPGGSTAYNMSAGGPIITPDCACITLTPLNPYSLTQRPLVFNADRRFDIKIIDPARFVPDGQQWPLLAGGDVITVRTHRKAMTVRHPNSYNYFSTLSQKLYWRND